MTAPGNAKVISVKYLWCPICQFSTSHLIIAGGDEYCEGCGAWNCFDEHESEDDNETE